MIKSSNSSGEPNTPKWLSCFAASVSVGNDFIREMNRQLGKQFRELTGIELESGFELVKPFPEEFRVVKTDDTSAIEGDLVGRRCGYQVEISWKDVAEVPDGTSDDAAVLSTIEFWWSYLPVDEILDAELSRNKPLFETSTLSYPLEFSIDVWPHLSLAIDFNNGFPENIDQIVKKHLLMAQNQWNSSPNKATGIIHFIGAVQLTKDHQVNVRIDFGSAGQAGLEYILQRLDAAQLPITRISIGSY